MVSVLFFCIDENIHKGHVLLLCQEEKNILKNEKKKMWKVKYIPWKVSSIWLLVIDQNK